MKSKLLLFDCRVSNLCTHRQPVIEAAVRAGYEVHVCTLVHADPSPLKSLPVQYHRIGPVSRRGGLFELSLVWRFRALVRQLNPDVCHFISIRSILYGLLTIAGRKESSTVSSVTGLGYLFIDQSLTSRVSRKLLSALIRLSLVRGSHTFVFQNKDDRAVFEAIGCLNRANRILIRGSGVDIERFEFGCLDESRKTVLFPARYLRHKGIVEFVEAAKLVRAQVDDVRFELAGDVDVNNPASVSTEWIEEAVVEGAVSDLGYQNDMTECLGRASIVCLPSYREGLPKALLEAASMGRPLIACDVPGCREVVIPGYNGTLVPKANAQELAEAIVRMLGNPSQMRDMGANSRDLVVREFSARKISAEFEKLYAEASKHGE